MPRRTSNRRGHVQWEQLIARYEAGNASQREFCAQHGVAYSSFCYWRKRLRASSTAEVVPLVELGALASSEQPPWRVEIDLGQGVVLRVR
jgi:transposase-like protein